MRIRNTTLAILWPIIFVGSVALAAAGDRYFSNPTLNKDVVIQVNKAGVMTDALKVSGSTGAVALRGRTDGTSPAAGEVGERITASLSNGSILSSPISSVNGGSISLTAGNWLVFPKFYIETVTGTMTVTSMTCSASLVSSAHNAPMSVNRLTVTMAPGDQEIIGGPLYVSVSTTTTAYLVVSATWTGGGTSRFNGFNSFLYAVRLP
jgi:hypothetical protein